MQMNSSKIAVKLAAIGLLAGFVASAAAAHDPTRTLTVRSTDGGAIATVEYNWELYHHVYGPRSKKIVIRDVKGDHKGPTVALKGYQSYYYHLTSGRGTSHTAYTRVFFSRVEVCNSPGQNCRTVAIPTRH
jgi:hypothetical protein